MLINAVEAGPVMMSVDSVEMNENLQLFAEPEFEVEYIYEPLLTPDDFSDRESYNTYIGTSTGGGLLERDVFASDTDYQNYINSWGGVDGFYDYLAENDEKYAVEKLRTYGPNWCA